MAEEKITVRQKLERIIEASPWQYAKSMPRQPHQYTQRRHAPSVADFEWFVQFIRDFGYDQRYNTMMIRYLDFGNLRYWTMGDTMEGTILINRARIYRPPFPVVRNPNPFKARAGAGDRMFRRKAKKG